MKTETPPTIRLEDYRPPEFLIDAVALDVRLAPSRTLVKARLKMRRNPASGVKRGPLVLDGERLELAGLRLDGRVLDPAAYDVGPVALTIGKPPEGPFTLEIETIIDPAANTALQGLYRSSGIYCTQCEAQGFRRITYFLDRPDVLATYTTRIEADRDEAAVLLSNGNRIERGTLDGGRRHYAVWKDPHPKPCYLFALVGGNLGSIASEFTTMSGRRVDLAIYVEAGKEARCGWAMEALKRSMAWDEQRFGREYDLEVFNIVAVSDFNMGAMENKGLNIFNDRLVLASPDTATDTNLFDIERVIAHEYFHNWTGNRITCRDWFQLCLKEGLTVFRDQEFSADQGSRAVQRIHDVRALKARQFPEDAGPLAHPVRPDRYMEINNFYTATVYEKGAELVRMIATLLGPEKFRAGMDRYFDAHDGRAATIEEFVACFEAAGGRDLKQFMTWYEQAGTPDLVCQLSHDAKTRIATLEVEQVLPATPGQASKKPLHIPLRMGLIGSNGHDVPLRLADGTKIDDGVLEITERRQSFRFADVPPGVVASLLRGFSAPVNLTIGRSEADLAFLIAHDADAFNRWQAVQDYAMRLMIEAVAAFQCGRTPKPPAAFLAALAAAVTERALEPALRAQLLMLPDEADVARVIARDIDPAAIHKARAWLRRRIGVGLGGALETIWRQNAIKGAYAATPDQIGRRASRNAALDLLAARGTADDIARVAAHFDKARNATDEIAALSILSHLRTPERTRAFARFHERWRDDHIVINQWFALQAGSSLPGTLATVRKLARHPLFSARNPNKVRALIGAFATNALNFNRADGAGYAFVAEQLLALDALNPQLAARQLSAFRGWATLESGRRQLARRALTGIAKSKTLSRDTREIVGRILG